MSNDLLKEYAKNNPKRNAVVIGLRDADNNILLMRTLKLPNWWQPAGGGIETSDNSPLAAAIREVEEELGVRLEPGMLLQSMSAPYDFGEGTIYFFESNINRELKIEIDIKEVIEYQWFSIEESLKLPVLPAATKFLKLLSQR